MLYCVFRKGLLHIFTKLTHCIILFVYVRLRVLEAEVFLCVFVLSPVPGTHEILAIDINRLFPLSVFFVLFQGFHIDSLGTIL